MITTIAHGRIWILWQWEYLQALRAGRPVKLIQFSNPEQLNLNWN